MRELERRVVEERKEVEMGRERCRRMGEAVEEEGVLGRRMRMRGEFEEAKEAKEAEGIGEMLGRAGILEEEDKSENG